ncbi:MAG: hypothetical protein M1835_006604 [Candelina submexicana]|nr:MAG: hypothetical protein M1835_006604 [Candelina submexicana]
MQLRSAVITALLLIGQSFPILAHAFAQFDKSIPIVYQRRHAELHTQVRRSVDHMLRGLQPRQASSAASSSPSASVTTQSTETAAVDPDTWNTRTVAACNSTLSALNGKASNPSGMAVCYNLPYLNNATGVFQADLRLYRIADPIDDWAGIRSQDVSVGLSYAGASVAAGSSKLKIRNDATLSSSTEDGDVIDVLGKRQSTVPKMLQVFNYVGQINNNSMGPNMNDAQYQTLLMPIITLNAVSSVKGSISTTLSSKDASFVNGVFADGKSSSTSTTTSATPFVLPGTTLGIFPTGLIITGSWAAIFVSVIGWGTMGRYQFREHYRRRMKRGQAIALRTI